MKKTIFLILALVLLANVASAIYLEGQAPPVGDVSILAADSRIMPPIPPDGTNIMGGNQYYMINYDGEGEATVIAKIEIQNIDKKNLSSLTFELPGSNLRIINIVQEYYDKMQQCVNYEEVCTNFENGQCTEFTRKCRNYVDQIVYPPKYAPIAYEKETLSKSTVLSFNLPREVTTQENAVVLIYYKSKDYSEKELFGWKTSFETIKLNADTQNVRVAINVDNDLVLEGKRAAVNYRENLVMADKSFAAPVAGAQSDSLQQLSSFVTWADGYVKTATGLDPLESFSVEASYAKSWLGLHWLGATISILGLLVFSLGLYALYVKKISRLKYGNMLAKISGLGIASAVSILLLWFLTSFLVNMVRQTLDWQTANLFAVLLYLMSGLMMLLIFFGPAVYMGVKHGLMAGVWTVVATVVMMFILMIIVLVFFLIFGNNQQYPGPIYRTMMGVAESTAVKSVA